MHELSSSTSLLEVRIVSTEHADDINSLFVVCGCLECLKVSVLGTDCKAVYVSFKFLGQRLVGWIIGKEGCV